MGDGVRTKSRPTIATGADLIPAHGSILFWSAFGDFYLQSPLQVLYQPILHCVRDTFESLDRLFAGAFAFSGIAPFQLRPLPGDVKRDFAPRRMAERPGDTVEPIPESTGDEIRNEEDRDRVVIGRKDRCPGYSEVSISVINCEDQRILPKRNSLVEMREQLQYAHHVVAMTAEVFEVAGQDLQIVAANAEIGHRESMQEEHGYTPRSQRSEQSKADIARDPGLNEFLDDVKIPLERVLSCLRVGKRKIECATMIFAQPSVG